jgi:predicted transcriptional regulator
MFKRDESLDTLLDLDRQTLVTCVMKKGNAMATRTLKIGIMPYEEMKARTIAIAKGNYKPAGSEPKVWFSSIKSLANVLSEENQTLLQVIREHNPESISELEQLTGRRASNLTRTLHTLESYGIISLKKARLGAGIKIKAARKSGRAPLKPVVMADAIDLKLSF